MWGAASTRMSASQRPVATERAPAAFIEDRARRATWLSAPRSAGPPASWPTARPRSSSSAIGPSLPQPLPWTIRKLLLLLAGVMAVVAGVPQVARAQEAGVIDVIQVSGRIDPVVADFVQGAVERAAA